jgi:hypothetical protein
MLSSIKEELMVEFYIYPEENENSFNPLNFIEKARTNYRNLLLRKDEIDDYSPANKQFLDWLQKS